MYYKTKDLGGFHAVELKIVEFTGEAFSGNPFDVSDEPEEATRLWLEERIQALISYEQLVLDRTLADQRCAVFWLLDSFGHNHQMLPGDRIVFVGGKHLYFGKACFEYLFEQVA